MKDSNNDTEYISEKRLTVNLSETSWMIIPDKVIIKGKLKEIEFVFQKIDNNVVLYRPSSRALSADPVCAAYRLYVNRDV